MSEQLATRLGECLITWSRKDRSPDAWTASITWDCLMELRKLAESCAPLRSERDELFLLASLWVTRMEPAAGGTEMVDIEASLVPHHTVAGWLQQDGMSNSEKNWRAKQEYERQFNQHPIPLGHTCRFCSISLSMDGPPTSHLSEWTAPSAVDPLAKDDRFYTCQGDACQQAGMELCDERRDLAYSAWRERDRFASAARGTGGNTAPALTIGASTSGRGGGGSGGHVTILTGDVTSDRWVGGTVAGSGGGGGATWCYDATQKPIRAASVALVTKDRVEVGREVRAEPLRPDGFRQSAVDAAKAVLLSATPKKVKP